MVKSAVAGSAGVANVCLLKREYECFNGCFDETHSANPNGDFVLFWKSMEAKVIPPELTPGTPLTDWVLVSHVTEDNAARPDATSAGKAVVPVTKQGEALMLNSEGTGAICKCQRWHD